MLVFLLEWLVLERCYFCCASVYVSMIRRRMYFMCRLFFDCSSSTFDCLFFFFLMNRRPPRSTLDRWSAASDVYKRQPREPSAPPAPSSTIRNRGAPPSTRATTWARLAPVSYTHLRAHETVLDIVCRLLLEKTKKEKKKKKNKHTCT